MISRLVSKTFNTRNAAHLAHFRTRSYAQHVALGAFYDGIIDKVDAIVEAYQGTHGLIVVSMDAYAIDHTAILEHLQSEMHWIKANREQIANGSPSVLNMLDDLHGLYAATVYKLRFLA